MTQEEKNLKLIEKEIEKIKNKKNKILFFVMDSKGAPIGSLAYIYETAYQLKELGYNVLMLHSEKEFVGVESWLGEKYSSLPHENINKRETSVSPSDILFIPELFANIMTYTKNLPCKRVAILQNLEYLTEFIQPGVSWEDLKIRDCVVTSEKLAERVKAYFPSVQTYVVRPSIPHYFKKSDEPKQLIINVVAREKSDTDAIIKPFYWLHPEYKWVAFRDIKNIPRENFANILKEGVATIWCDGGTCFGYSALEAMAEGNVVIGKIPENEPEWMFKDGQLLNNGLWYYNTKDAPDVIASFIEAYITNSIPQEMYDEMEETVKPYSEEMQQKDIKRCYVDEIFTYHQKTLEAYLRAIKVSQEGEVTTAPDNNDKKNEESK
jgi:hypothetical protein